MTAEEAGLPGDSEIEIDQELLSLKLDYAWRWFALHARQRVTMFNFFLIASGVVANAYGLLLREKEWSAAMVVAAIGCVIGLASMVLDVRNRQLVKLGEEALTVIEVKYLFPAEIRPGFDNPLRSGILARESKNIGLDSLIKHKFIFRILESVVAAAFVAAAIYAWHMH